MKALQLAKTRTLRIIDIPIPKIADDEILLKVKKVGICGTDLHLYNGGMKVPLPLTPGHEFVGDVEAVGAKVSTITVGDRAVAEHVIGCGTCRFCVYGKKNLCVNPTIIGLHQPGALQEYMAIPADLVYVLPDSIPYDQGVLVEPLSIAVYGVRKASVAVGDTVVVVGQGPIGLFLDQVAKAAGATVVGIDIMPARLQYAQKHHFADNVFNAKDDVVKPFSNQFQSGADVVFEVVGQQSTTRLALELARPDGAVVILGVFEHDVTIPMMNVVKHELRVMGSWTCLNAFEPTINLLASGRISTDGLITHRYPFAQAEKAFIEASEYSDNRIKSVIEF